jgi:hypothetical protein
MKNVLTNTLAILFLLYPLLVFLIAGYSFIAIFNNGIGVLANSLLDQLAFAVFYWTLPLLVAVYAIAMALEFSIHNIAKGHANYMSNDMTFFTLITHQILMLITLVKTTLDHVYLANTVSYWIASIIVLISVSIAVYGMVFHGLTELSRRRKFLAWFGAIAIIAGILFVGRYLVLALGFVLFFKFLIAALFVFIVPGSLLLEEYPTTFKKVIGYSIAYICIAGYGYLLIAAIIAVNHPLL